MNAKILLRRQKNSTDLWHYGSSCFRLAMYHSTCVISLGMVTTHWRLGGPCSRYPNEKIQALLIQTICHRKCEQEWLLWFYFMHSTLFCCALVVLACFGICAHYSALHYGPNYGLESCEAAKMSNNYSLLDQPFLCEGQVDGRLFGGWLLCVSCSWESFHNFVFQVGSTLQRKFK